MSVKHIVSTEGNFWTESLTEQAIYEDKLIVTDTKKQEIKGFGGCFNELGWDALQKANEAEKKAFLDELFDTDKGNFNYGRVPIGANDFSLEWYSCDETDGDYELKDFNIERDKTYTLPFIKEAIARQKEGFAVFASPWSPPTWMKTKKAYNFGTLRMEEKVLRAYAAYFAKFVKAYQEEGVTVNQIHVQNEPMADQKFPSCKWTGPQMRDFIRDYLGPLFEEQGLDTEIWLGTINGPFMDMYMNNTAFSEFYDGFINTILSDKRAKKYIAGVGLQWGGKHVLEQVELAYPELKIMQTESECGDGQNSFEHMEYVSSLMWQYFRHGAEKYTYWNIALTDESVSTWGWKQNSLCTVNEESGKINYQPEYYLMKHYSQFIRPGAKYLESKGRWSANSSVFENPDGSVVVVATNHMHEKREMSIQVKGQVVSATIEPHSLHTFVIN
ncbi:glycoside hydrolase family 30 protein [Scatolibacter rhodanostii]|uniref:glycoside hydrolase family 30 protein n=1 Tax=Scatolibacter rhodanostii TaxID=2014781 RepID=UPI001FA8201C|nr:glycoside hydrolase family 30 beta sandwich domain-containing protein [Scatolibacter rhodanostii]